MTAANLLFAPSRNLSLEGQITYLTGDQVDFDGENALSCTVAEGSADGRLLGGAFSAACTLTLHNQNGLFPESRSLRGAQVKVILRAGEDAYPLCVFTVATVSRRENDCRLILRGSDALGTAFEGLLQDDFSYPRTLGALSQAVAAQAGFLLSTDFPNAGFMIPARPQWGDISLRQALAFIACAAGCFARVSRSGKLEFCPVWQREATPYALPAEMTLSREYGEASFGPLTGLSVSCYQAPKDASPLIATLSDAPLAETNSLSISGNPLFPHEGSHTQSLLAAALNALSGLQTRRARVTWRGDPTLTVGSRLRITDTAGVATETLVTAQTLTFFRGFSMETQCAHPAPQAAVGRIFTPSGALNAAMLQGSVDGVIIRDGTLAARALVAGSVTAQQIAAGAITADKIAAGAINAQALTAVKAEIRRLAAGEITTDQLYADLAAIARAQITTAQIDQADIDWASIRLLSAASADIAKAEISEAKIGHSQIYDLDADTALIERGSAGKFFFRRLAVDSAQMVDLTVGQLTVKAADGNYYSLNVDLDSGAVTAEQVTVTLDEIAAGKTISGQHIIETDLTVSDLNASSATAVEALINKLTAGRIDVDTLFAREAVLHKIEGMDITGNQYLRLLVSSRSRNYCQWEDPALTPANGVQEGDIWEQGIPYTTWARMAELTWEEAAAYPWWAYAGPRLHIRKNGAWEVVTDPKELLEQKYQLNRYRAQVLLTDEKINMQVRRQSETRQELGDLSVRADSIQQRVTRQEQDISSLRTFQSEASQKIEPGRIIQTVRDSVSYQNDLNGKESAGAAANALTQARGYTQAQVEALSKQITLRVEGVEDTITEGVPKVKNSAVVIGLEGIDLKTGGVFTVESGKFSIDENGNVSLTGRVTAGSGAIGGWKLEQSKLKSGAGSNYVHMDSTGDYPFLAGNDTEASAPFRVKRDGTVYLTKLIAVDEQGKETTVNLTNYPFWKLWYNTVTGYTENSITLSNGATVNFNTAASVTLEGSWSGNTFTVEASNGQSQEETFTAGKGTGSQNAGGQYTINEFSNHKAYGYVNAESLPSGRLFTFNVDASGEYAAGQNSVNVHKHGWSGGILSLTPSEGLGLGATVQLSKGTEKWNENSVSFPIMDGGGGTGYTCTVNAQSRYDAGYAAGWAAARAVMGISGNQISGPAETVGSSEVVYTITANGSISSISNTAPGYYFAEGRAYASVNGSAVDSQYLSASQQFST